MELLYEKRLRGLSWIDLIWFDFWFVVLLVGWFGFFWGHFIIVIKRLKIEVAFQREPIDVVVVLVDVIEDLSWASSSCWIRIRIFMMSFCDSSSFICNNWTSCSRFSVAIFRLNRPSRAARRAFSARCLRSSSFCASVMVINCFCRPRPLAGLWSTGNISPTLDFFFDLDVRPLLELRKERALLLDVLGLLTLPVVAAVVELELEVERELVLPVAFRFRAGEVALDPARNLRWGEEEDVDEEENSFEVWSSSTSESKMFAMISSRATTSMVEEVP